MSWDATADRCFHGDQGLRSIRSRTHFKPESISARSCNTSPNPLPEGPRRPAHPEQLPTRPGVEARTGHSPSRPRTRGRTRNEVAVDHRVLAGAHTPRGDRPHPFQSRRDRASPREAGRQAATDQCGRPGCAMRGLDGPCAAGLRSLPRAAADDGSPWVGPRLYRRRNQPGPLQDRPARRSFNTPSASHFLQSAARECLTTHPNATPLRLPATGRSVPACPKTPRHARPPPKRPDSLAA